jgi:hypothetical protein
MRQFGKTPSNCQSKSHTPRIIPVAVVLALAILALAVLSSYALAAPGESQGAGAKTSAPGVSTLWSLTGE